jgi:hypothetical protein
MVINVEIAGTELIFAELNHILEDLGFVRWAWDYEHVTYDYKLVESQTKTTYYLRIQANLVHGQTEDHEAVLKLGEPHIGKHLFPHGIDYEAVIPTTVMNAAKEKLTAIKKKL